MHSVSQHQPEASVGGSGYHSTWEVEMRGLALFVAGTLVGVAVTGLAQSQTQNHGIVGLNHVALSVPDLDKAVEYYTKTMGFPEAFRLTNASGQVQLVYVQISQNTFIELQPATAQRPPGINHFGVHVENMAAATAMFKERGAAVGETNVSGTKAILSNVVDPNGVRMELAELPPESLHRQAMQRWR
jgi:catechol 2,3-dioxygenase-like lactoylglutathione lyase family enzyme